MEFDPQDMKVPCPYCPDEGGIFPHPDWLQCYNGKINLAEWMSLVNRTVVWATEMAKRQEVEDDG